jgi:RNA polymerase sigma-70 factor (ECF subfamily)
MVLEKEPPPIQKRNFGDVARAELPVLYRVARRFTLDSTIAEDLVSQTLVKAHEHWHEFDGRYARSWMLQIMRNEWLNLRRKQAIRQELPYDSVAEPSDEQFWCAIEVKLDAETVLEAIDNLPEEYRLAVTLCDVEEMKYEEAAEVLMVPVGTIRSRLFRGRRMLRNWLATQHRGDGNAESH